MRFGLLFLALTVLLSGCATGDYKHYADAQMAMQIARSTAEAEKYKAIAAIAQSGDTATKVAAMFSLHSQGAQPQQASGISAPKSGSDSAKEWLGLLLPAVVQGYGIQANQVIATTQSNNAREVAISTNSAIVGIASQIQAPAANVATSINTATNTTTDRHDVAGSYNPTDNHSVQNPPALAIP